FISQLSQDLILEMLHQANKRKGPISESFMHLIQKIGPTINENDINPSINNTLELIDSTKNQYLELFNQEDYGKYIDQDYDSTLRQLSSRCPINKDNAEKISEKVEDFNRSNLNLHILRAFKSLMENCVVPDEYNDYAAKIIEIAKENIKRKNYEYAFEAIAVFHQHNSSEKPEEIAQAARKALSQLTDSKLLEDLIQTLDDPKTKLPPAIDSLLNAIGPKIVSPLVKRFIQGGYGEKQHSVLNILKHFKKESVAAAHQLVEHDNVEKIKKLIFLIRQIDDRASSAYLRSLVAHANRSVSREALAALLYFTDPWGIIFLRDQLNSKNSDDMTQAITISGDYHVIEMVPHLIAYLKYNALSKTDIRNNRNLIIALGKIGDTAALPHLEKMIRSAWSIYRSNLKQLKIDIFNSLNNYPIDKIEPLVMLGNKIKDKYINQICNQLSHKTIITPSASGTSSASISKHTPTQDD
ncbi:MAG: HEAT repeat domain-containing protein, partial [Desulfobacteraceae bacterium]